MENGYDMAFSEVVCLIEQSDDNYRSKIPQNFMKFLQENANQTYHPRFSIDTPIKDLNLRKETKGLLALIYRDFICTPEEKKEYNDLLKTNDERKQQELNEKFDIYKKFEERQNATAVSSTTDNIEQVDSTQLNMVQYKQESFFRKIINLIKSLFRRK